MAKLPKEPPGSAITPPALYAARREFLKKAGLFAVTGAAWGGALVALSSRGSADPPPRSPAPPPPPEAASGPDPWRHIVRSSGYDTGEDPTRFEDITTYNNFYELGLAKADPAKRAELLTLRPWTVRIEGECHKPQTVDIDALIRWFPLEQRIYRMRCVEAWSMVIPWVGFPLGTLVERVEPTSRAKWVAFETLFDPKRLPGQKRDVLPWPYVEGLRIDEAIHPLTLLATGLYDAPLLAQNGAPLRLVVPWKYGFKGIKSIVRIRLTETQPPATWNQVQPNEYGFYANVNPEVDHPRWSQKTERRIGQLSRIATRMFNGYGEHVAHLYRGMDLTRYF